VTALLKKQHYGLKDAIATKPFVTHHEAVFLIQTINTFSEVGINPVEYE
jgi:hypothetical protein